MTEEQRAAFLISQSVVTMVEALGMVAANDYRKHRGEVIAYDEAAFEELIQRSGIGHNAALGTLRDR